MITARRLDAVRLLAAEGIPVMGHLGFVPKKSTIYGGVRTVGHTAVEATVLWQQFRQLEDAGAFAVECELIPARVLAEIDRRTSMATITLGSGADANVMFLFSSDICGESARTPRHARVYGDVGGLQAQIAAERVRALSAFRADVVAGGFPKESEVTKISDDELEAFGGAFDAPEARPSHRYAVPWRTGGSAICTIAPGKLPASRQRSRWPA